MNSELAECNPSTEPVLNSCKPTIGRVSTFKLEGVNLLLEALVVYNTDALFEFFLKKYRALSSVMW